MSECLQGQCPAPSWIAAIAQQDVEVLNRRNEIFLDLHAPQPPPARAVKPIAGPSGEGAFHQVLTHPDIPPCRSGSTACPHAIEGVLAEVPRERISPVSVDKAVNICLLAPIKWAQMALVERFAYFLGIGAVRTVHTRCCSNKLSM